MLVAIANRELLLQLCWLVGHHGSHNVRLSLLVSIAFDIFLCAELKCTASLG